MARQKITVGQMGLFEVDEHNQLFWNGAAVVIEQRFTLGTIERWIAGLAALATVVAAFWPIAIYFGWFGLTTAS